MVEDLKIEKTIKSEEKKKSSSKKKKTKHKTKTQKRNKTSGQDDSQKEEAPGVLRYRGSTCVALLIGPKQPANAAPKSKPKSKSICVQTKKSELFVCLCFFKKRENKDEKQSKIKRLKT